MKDIAFFKVLLACLILSSVAGNSYATSMPSYTTSTASYIQINGDVIDLPSATGAIINKYICGFPSIKSLNY